jgi:hypothetical protein
VSPEVAFALALTFGPPAPAPVAPAIVARAEPVYDLWLIEGRYVYLPRGTVPQVCPGGACEVPRKPAAWFSRPR